MLTQRVPILGGELSETGRQAIKRGWQGVNIGPALHEGMQGRLRWLGDSQCQWMSFGRGNDGLVGNHSWADIVKDGEFAVRYLPVYSNGQYFVADISFALSMATREGGAGTM